jgi:hypothetical protein
MPHRQILLVTLLTLAAVGVATLLLVMSPAMPGSPHVLWWFFLVLLPLVLAAAILLGWGWAAMASVAYGTIGLAIDLATVVSILGGREGSDLTIALSVVNGSANFALIVFGGRAFWTVLQGLRPRGSRPPNPPSPSPSSRT